MRPGRLLLLALVAAVLGDALGTAVVLGLAAAVAAVVVFAVWRTHRVPS